MKVLSRHSSHHCIALWPPLCCRCNASGHCKNCACRKANRQCLNCLPCHLSHCQNLPTTIAKPRAETRCRILETTKESVKTSNSPETSPQPCQAHDNATTPDTQETIVTLPPGVSAESELTSLRELQDPTELAASITPFPPFLPLQSLPLLGEMSRVHHSAVL